MNKRFTIREKTDLIEEKDLTEEEILLRQKWYDEWRKTGVKPSGKQPKLKRNRTTRIRNHKIPTPTVVCAGVSKKGLPCRNRTKNPSGYCHHH